MSGKPYLGYIVGGISLASLVLYDSAKAHHPELPELNSLNCLYPLLSISTIGGLLYSYFSLSQNKKKEDIIEGEYQVIDNTYNIDKRI